MLHWKGGFTVLAMPRYRASTSGPPGGEVIYGTGFIRLRGWDLKHPPFLPSSGGITSKTLFRKFSFEYIAAANPLCPSNSLKNEYVETPSPITLWYSVLSIVNLSLFLVLADLSRYNVRFLNLLTDQLLLQQHREQDDLMLTPGNESAQWPFHSTSFAHGFWTSTSLWPSTSLTYNNEHACPCTITLWFSLCSSTCSPRVLGAPSMQ